MEVEEAVFRERLRAVERDVSHLKEWQDKQNGTMGRIENKLDRLIFWMMTTALGALLSLFIAVVVYFINRPGA